MKSILWESGEKSSPIWGKALHMGAERAFSVPGVAKGPLSTPSLGTSK
jgi:hypothetical protein